ncbi:hypothetical protein T265_02066 [Opisthorchis viverrini]|uniref:Cysteine dioxygenase n=2 Tax=Opisthorchis viverrini TaxID=6198 RepID=A0A075A0D4_OPIVI|nr:hypothetical protein T265_02066 [Opisthorchis viverrini]KER31692.1 hypothetical protein T265_02066 [Opisthorchis viverrini]
MQFEQRIVGNRMVNTRTTTDLGGSQVITLKQLGEELHRIFEHDFVDIDEVKQLLGSCTSDPLEWQSFAHFDKYRYTRNLVDAGNERFNLLILCWGEGHGTSIHDHDGSHCFLKVLAGEIRESLYAWPPGFDNSRLDSDIPPRLVRVSDFRFGDVTYIHDTIGLHRLENTSHTQKSVTLHVYCPPIRQSTMFDERTGRASKCKMTFYSQCGERRRPSLVEAPFTQQPSR